MKKGQYFTFDVIVAGIIAVFTLILLLSYWRYALENSTLVKDTLTKEAIRVSNLLMSPNGDYSIIKANTTSVLKDKQAIYSVCEELNRSLPYKLTVIEHTPEGSAILFGSSTIGAPSDKVYRVAYDEELNTMVLLEIYVSE